MSEGFVGRLSFGAQVALLPGVDPDEFAEELAEFIEFNLDGTIGVGIGASPAACTTPTTRMRPGIRRSSLYRALSNAVRGRSRPLSCARVATQRGR